MQNISAYSCQCKVCHTKYVLKSGITRPQLPNGKQVKTSSYPLAAISKNGLKRWQLPQEQTIPFFF